MTAILDWTIPNPPTHPGLTPTTPPMYEEGKRLPDPAPRPVPHDLPQPHLDLAPTQRTEKIEDNHIATGPFMCSHNASLHARRYGTRKAASVTGITRER